VEVVAVAEVVAVVTQVVLMVFRDLLIPVEEEAAQEPRLPLQPLTQVVLAAPA
jgi:hypothetical protein